MYAEAYSYHNAEVITAYNNKKASRELAIVLSEQHIVASLSV